MKPIISRSFLVAFFVAIGLARSLAQTTINLPTIPCATCNGPSSFATTAPTCTAGLLGAPLTMSWGAAAGATTYTILIATDANLSQNVATHTITGTSLSVPAYALAPSTTYYWTVIANNASGSTKATGGVCTFSTNATWTGNSPTGGFPNGDPGTEMTNNVDLGYFSCQSGDGTCASNDNLICNPTFKFLSGSNRFTPYWNTLDGTWDSPPAQTGVDLSAESVSIVPVTGTTTAGKITPHGYTGIFEQLMIRNTSANPVNYRVSFAALTTTNATLTIRVGLLRYGSGFSPSMGGIGGTALATTQTNLTTNTWGSYNLNLSLPAGSTTSAFFIENVNGDAGNNANNYITDLKLCKL